MQSFALNFFKTHKNLSILLGIALFWFLIFVTSGTLFSGFHFTDDHDIVAIHYYLTVKQMHLFQVIYQWLQEDHATGRFRTFYFISRIIQTKFLGIHFPLWAICIGLMGVFTTFCLFIFGQLLQFSLLESILLAFLTTLGSQSAIWWQLGPSETVGTFLLALGLVLIALSSQPRKFRVAYEGLGLLCIIGMSLSKESFVLLIPAVGLIQLWLAKKQTDSWRRAIVQKLPAQLILMGVLIAELLFIKYFVGTTPEIGYAGFDGFKIGAIVHAFKSLSDRGDGWIILIGLGLLFATQFIRLKPINLRSIRLKLIRLSLLAVGNASAPVLKDLAFPITLLILIVIPQVLLYAKSGIVQRYLLPGIFAYSFCLIWIYQRLKQNSQRFSSVILLLIMLSLSLKLHLAWGAAHTFALEGKSTNKLLQEIVARTEKTDPILLITNPLIYSEWNFSIKKYLNYAANRSQVYVSTYEQYDGNNMAAKLRTFYNGATLDKIQHKNTIGCVVVFPLMNAIFLRNSSNWFNQQNYRELTFGNFNRNLNPNSEIHLYCKNSPKLSTTTE